MAENAAFVNIELSEQDELAILSISHVSSNASFMMSTSARCPVRISCPSSSWSRSNLFHHLRVVFMMTIDATACSVTY